jgi:DNA-binding winged helix-turn-helix (wHTH) protein
MESDLFILDERFIIEPARGLVTDNQAASVTRIEPRVMSLLCLLVQHSGQMVARETITREIWEDYGNADEGLTQAISYLRRVLKDDAKTGIGTVPKKGYILHMAVRRCEPGEGARETSGVRRGVRGSLLWITALMFLIVLFFFIYRKLHSADTIGSPTPASVSADRIPDSAR